MKEGSVQQSSQGVVQAKWQPKSLYKCSIDTVQADKYMQITVSRTATRVPMEGAARSGRSWPGFSDKSGSPAIQVVLDHAAIGICLTASSGPSRDSA